MSQDTKDAKRLKFDKRLEEWNLRNGVLKKNELETHNKELPDVSNNALPIDLEEKRH